LKNVQEIENSLKELEAAAPTSKNSWHRHTSLILHFSQ
jgi:hypothetical protein